MLTSAPRKEWLASGEFCVYFITNTGAYVVHGDFLKKKNGAVLVSVRLQMRERCVYLPSGVCVGSLIQLFESVKRFEGLSVHGELSICHSSVASFL